MVFTGPAIPTARQPIWTWDAATLTLRPSVRVRWRDETDAEHVCHYFLTMGQLVYIVDSTHALAGQTVPLPEFPPPRLRGREKEE